MFTDPYLQQLIQQGLDNNTDLQSAYWRVKEAEATLKSARLAYLPSFNFAPNGGVSSLTNPWNATWTYTVPVTASWEVDIFGKLTNSKRRAKALLAQSQEYQQAVRTQVIASVANLYYTLLMLLVSILVAAVCLSSYLVSRKKTMLFLSVAFAFYFFDISLVFQDEFIVRSSGDALTSGYLVIRSLASVLTGGGFVTAFWVLLCDYLNETRRSMFVVPPAVFAVASIATLVFLPDGDLQRFWFWSIRQFYIYWILLYAGYSFLRQKDEAERARMWRHRGLYAVAWLLGLIVLAEDAVSFLMMDLPLVNLGSIIFSAERSYAENLLMLVIGVAAVRNAVRMLSLRFERPPAQGGSKQQEQQIIENLNVFATRHKLSQREREVLYLILLGKDNQNIASEMSLALSTVKVHVHNILKKTAQANRQELMRDFRKMS